MSSNGKIVLNVLNWTWSSLAHYLQSFTSELFKKLLQMYLKKRRKVLEVAKVERMGDNKHDGLCMSDNFFYSRMTPHWNLCEQRQDNWQDKGQKQAKSAQKHPFFHSFKKVWIWHD